MRLILTSLSGLLFATLLLFSVLFAGSLFAGSLPCGGAEGEAHPNGGGFIASTATAMKSAEIGPMVQVCDSAHVGGNAQIIGKVSVVCDTVIAPYEKIINESFRGQLRIAECSYNK